MGGNIDMDITDGISWKGLWNKDIKRFDGQYRSMDDDTVYLLNVKATIEYYYYKGDINLKDFVENQNRFMRINAGFYEQVIAICTNKCVDGYWNDDIKKWVYPLATDFWKHGKNGNIDIVENVTTAHWYGMQHPFEFEVMPGLISNMESYNNLEIISNEVEPESIHITWDADVYEFRKDFKNEYFRQEATKCLYQYNFHDIRYNEHFTDHVTEQRMLYYRPNYPVADKSVLFPLFYSRVDTYNEIYDSYQRMTAPSVDYQYMSGTEVTYDSLLDSYGLSVHIKANPINHWYKQYITLQTANTPKYKNIAYIDKLKDPNIKDEYLPFSEATEQDKQNYAIFVWLQYDRLRGNCWYRDSKWYIQLPSFPIYEINETKWSTLGYGFNSPIINLSLYPLPEETARLTFDIPPVLANMSYGVNGSIIMDNRWLQKRKDVRILGKTAKVRVRYKGDKSVLVKSIDTLTSTL